MTGISSLKPELLWKHFAALCRIPRPSKHEKAAARYVQEFAGSLGLEVKTDNAGMCLSENLHLQERKTGQLLYSRAISIWFLRKTPGLSMTS